MTDVTDTARAKAKLWDLIRDIEVAMMTTVDQDGSLRSRPMATRNGRDGSPEIKGGLWFFTRAGAPKSAELERHDHVNLSYANPDDQNYVSVSGSAEVIRDRAMIDELWTEALTTWFPNGKRDPEVALLKVTVDKAEFWDTPSSTMVNAYGYVKAKLTGKSPHPGEHAKVNLH